MKRAPRREDRGAPPPASPPADPQDNKYVSEGKPCRIGGVRVDRKKLKQALPVLLLFLFVFVVLVVRERAPSPIIIQELQVLPDLKKHSDPAVHDFSCPDEVSRPENEFGFQGRYGRPARIMTKNATELLEGLQNMLYDEWMRPYHQFKKEIYEWKKLQFANNLEEGDSIYESACGVGLNLYMTLEILNEVKGLESLTVYGNEYVRESVEKANFIYDEASPFSSKKGKICRGDSTNLAYVPSDAFDLVYTGYISPLLNPLDLDGRSAGDIQKEMKKLCKEDDWRSKKLAELAQQKQNDFYGKWVSEMVRIAKPGKAIIIEQIGSPVCENANDLGGGVAKAWWPLAVGKYNWDVDPASIVFGNETLYTAYSRYHVAMKKNPRQQETKHGPTAVAA